MTANPSRISRPSGSPLGHPASPPQGDVELLERLTRARADLLAQVGRRIVGQTDVLDGILTAVFSGGHALLLGVPGLAKTLMVQTVAQTLDLKFSRIQFTPDLMPTDITGTEIIEEDQATGKRAFRFVRGPVFANIVLADEVNRTPPKTQAALLQAMQEHQVTAAGQTHPLPAPFFVLATQNPIEQEGTYPLPEAQLDRFLLKVLVTYADEETEREILRRYHRGFDPHHLEAAGLRPVLGQEELLACRREVQAVTVDEALVDYTTRLVRATRESTDLVLGSSVRGAITLLLASKALAAVRGRDYVVPDDVKELARPALRHRVLLQPEAEIQGLTADDVVERVFGGLEVPR